MSQLKHLYGPLLVGLVGILVILGWCFHWTAAIQLHSKWVPMQFNTAVCFVLIACGSVLLTFEKARFAQLCAGLTFTLAFLTLAQYLLGISFGIDQLLMSHYITVETSHPGRMAPNTAVCFLLSSILIYTTSRQRSATQEKSAVTLAAVLLAFSCVPFFGYLANVSTAYAWGKLTSMAFHTSMLFMLFALNHLIASWSQSPSPIPIWLPQISLVCGLAITTLFWQSFSSPNYIQSRTIPLLFLLLLGISTSIILAALVFSWIRVRESEKSLKLYSKTLEEKNEMLEEFAKILAHDLKTPLVSIGVWTGMVRVRDEPVEFLSKVEEKVTHMDRMINDLRDYVNDPAGRQNVSTFDLRTLTDNVIQTVHVPARFQIDFPGTKNLMVTTCHAPLEICLRNLISNSIQHHDRPDGKVSVGYELFPDSIEITVADDGPGIDANYQQQVFKPFRKLNPSQQRTGMGLSLVKKHVDRINGTIQFLANQSERGTTIQISWPVKNASPVSDS